MTSYDPTAGRAPRPQSPQQPDTPEQHDTPEPHDMPDSGRARARVGTVVWGLVVLALAGLIIITGLDLVVLDGTYVVIGLMLGAGAALVIGGLVSARGRDKEPTKGKS